MNELFGLPMNVLMWTFGIGLVIVVLWSLFLTLRQPVLFRLAARNIPRRWGRSMLIVLGLTLATTIITAALATGDTVANTARSDVLSSLGNIDEVIGAQEESDIELTGEQGRVQYFDQAYFDQIRDALAASPDVDGVMPTIWEDVALQNLTTRQTEPRVVALGADPRYMQGFGVIRDQNGDPFELAALAQGEVLLNKDAADELDASPGDSIVLYAAGQQLNARVRAVVSYRGIGTTDSGLIMPLAAAQDLFGKQGLIQHVVISNRGGEESGARLTDRVIGQVQPVLSRLGLAVEPTKRDDLKSADEAGASFSTFFVTFGSFSIAAGILLIFLLFVTLSGERKPEMGIARAVGTERVHLIEMFMFEGLLYDVVAAAIGVLAGVGVAFIMVTALGAAMTDFGVNIRFSVSTRSLITAYAMGVDLTFIVVTLSAWRVSVLNIVSAVRNLPEPVASRTGRASLVWGLLGMLLGALLTWQGIEAEQGTPFYLGVSLLILATVPIMRWAGVPDRFAFTLAGTLTVFFWLLPFSAMDWFLPEMTSDFNLAVISGLVTVTGATWVVIYNSDVILGFALSTLGRIKGLAPTLKTALTYPLTNRFRTGVTLAMFTLVVFVLVVGGIAVTAFTEAFNDVGLYGGGFDVRAATAPVSPINDLGAAIDQTPQLDRGAYQAIAAQSLVPVEARQANTDREFGDYPLRGVDAAFFANTTYGFSAIAEGYASDAEVWQAIESNPNLAVVDVLPAPSRGQMEFGAPAPDFRLQGFYVEDGTFKPIPVQVRDPVTGRTHDLTIIGVLQEVVPAYMIGITTSQAFVDEAFPEQAAPAAYLIKLRPGTDTKAAADGLESAFLANGLEATVLKEELADVVSVNQTFNYLIQGFVGLGLVIGVAALGVISARAVVERRQEIGVMRAIGFEQGRVQLSFLIESSLVAAGGILIGTFLGVVIAYNIITDAQSQASWQNLRFDVPWLNLLIIYAVVMVAALVTSFIPARGASRVYPAEALRYE